jgi:hypothetical protein
VLLADPYQPAPSVLRDLFTDLLGDWRGRAACRDEPDPGIFLFDKRRDPHSPTLALAMAICAECPVRRQCLSDALTPVVIVVGLEPPLQVHGVMSGVWGGTTEPERMAARALEPEAAVDLLEATFPDRLQRVLDRVPRDVGQGLTKERKRRLRDLVAQWDESEGVA